MATQTPKTTAALVVILTALILSVATFVTAPAASAVEIGGVSIERVNGHLEIDGTNGADHITVQASGESSTSVRYKVTVEVGGVQQSEYIQGITGDVRIDLGRGYNQLRVLEAEFSGPTRVRNNLVIDGYSGMDQVYISDVTVDNGLWINLRGGENSATIYGSTIAGQGKYTGFGGIDRFVMTDSTVALGWVAQTNAGDDEIRFNGVETSASSLQGGRGNDFIQIMSGVIGSHFVDGGPGNDVIRDTPRVTTRTRVTGGDGNDELSIRPRRFYNPHEHKEFTPLVVQGGNGNDIMYLFGHLADEDTFDGNAGVDTLNVWDVDRSAEDFTVLRFERMNFDDTRIDPHEGY